MADEIYRQVDPICGAEVDPGHITAQYEGTTYHFCSEACRDEFNAHPEAYAREVA